MFGVCESMLWTDETTLAGLATATLNILPIIIIIITIVMTMVILPPYHYIVER